MRWLYHVVLEDVTVADPYAPDSFVQEGYIHCSFREDVVTSARLYFPADARLRVLQIDPRRLGCELRVAATPRGPMPHVHGRIPRAAIVRELGLDQVRDAPDAVDDAGSG